MQAHVPSQKRVGVKKSSPTGVSRTRRFTAATFRRWHRPRNAFLVLTLLLFAALPLRVALANSLVFCHEQGCAADRGFVRHRRGWHLARGRQGQADWQGAEHRHPELWRTRGGEGPATCLAFPRINKLRGSRRTRDFGDLFESTRVHTGRAPLNFTQSSDTARCCVHMRTLEARKSGFEQPSLDLVFVWSR